MRSVFRNIPIISALALAICLLSFSTRAMAQGGTATITGQVTDPSGAVVPAAKVTLTNAATGQSTSTVTTTAGIYTFTAVPVVGTYTMRIEASGFMAFEVRGIVVSVGRVTTEDARL